jgi:transcriptional regulator with XRE-family HTH domain
MYFILATAEEIQRELGRRLRSQRLAQALSQHELAAMAGLSLGAVRKLESGGRCALETLTRITQALGLAEELQPLFLSKRQSIAQMEAAVQPQRRRAPRCKRS